MRLLRRGGGRDRRKSREKGQGEGERLTLLHRDHAKISLSDDGMKTGGDAFEACADGQRRLNREDRGGGQTHREQAERYRPHELADRQRWS